MAKVSEKKKVELLETAVLSGDIEAVKKVIETYREFEFTARLPLYECEDGACTGGKWYDVPLQQ